MSGFEARLTPGPLHRLDGLLAESGWATSPVRAYERDRLKVPKRWIREWDRYLVHDDEFVVILSVADLGHVGFASASVVDFSQAASHTASVVVPFPLGRFGLPASSDAGATSFESGRTSFLFEVGDGFRRLTVRFASFDGNDDLAFEAVLDEEPRDSAVVSTLTGEDSLAFRYSRKTFAMRVRGSLKKGLLVHGFCPDNSFGALDWGRGAWSRWGDWRWAAAQGWQEGRRFGLSLGCGPGGASAVSESAAFVDGAAHRLSGVDFAIPERTGGARARRLSDRYQLMRPWRLGDAEGRLDLVFTPLLDCAGHAGFDPLGVDRCQAFGRFDGSVALDDGERFSVEALLGFAEVARAAR